MLRSNSKQYGGIHVVKTARKKSGKDLLKSRDADFND